MVITLLVFFEVILLVHGLSKADGVQWEPLSRPIVFNEDVVLVCEVPGKCCKHNVRKWLADNELISFDEISIQKVKYHAVLQNNGFSLTIRNFNTDDYRKTYTCVYGFEQYTASLEREPYLWLPTKESLGISYSFHGRTFTAMVEFSKVFPEPRCNTSLEAIPVPSHSQSTFNDHELTLKVNVSVYHIVNTSTCQINVMMVCYSGNSSIPIIDETLIDPTCTEASDALKPLGLLAIPVVVSLLVIIVIFIVYKRHKKSETNSTETDQNELESCIQPDVKQKTTSGMDKCDTSFVQEGTSYYSTEQEETSYDSEGNSYGYESDYY